jgi:branched-chain amino acid transport system substrate-binding protein
LRGTAAGIASMRFLTLALAVLTCSLAQPALADIAIGVAGPMSGVFAVLGGQMRAGAEAAIADVNVAGGVLGQQLILAVADDACDAKQAIAAAGELTAKKVALVVGHLCSSASIPASAIYFDAGVIQISPASTNPAYTDNRPGPGTFRVCGRDDQQGEIAGAFLIRNFPGKKIAIVDDKSPYGKALADQARKSFGAAGGKEVLYEEYTAGARDYTALISRLKTTGTEVLYVGGYAADAGLIARQIKDQGMATVLVGADALATEDFLKVAGDAGQGALVTFPPDPRKNPDNAALVDRLRKQGIEPQGYTLAAYAAVQIWAAATAAAGSTAFDKVAAAVSTGNFNTALGTVKFDAKGDTSAPGYIFYQWKDGDFQKFIQ